MDKRVQDIEVEITKLELQNRDLLEELTKLDQLMRKVGFSEGLITVKETAKALKNSQE